MAGHAGATANGSKSSSRRGGGEGSFFLAAERSIERLNEASAAGISIAAASHLVQKIIKKT